MNVRSVVVRRMGVCILCVDDNEQRERGVGVGVNDTMLSEYESIKRKINKRLVLECRCDARLKAK